MPVPMKLWFKSAAFEAMTAPITRRAQRARPAAAASRRPSNLLTRLLDALVTRAEAEVAGP